MADLKRSAEDMKCVYMVTHEYERPTGEEEYKVVGIYRTKHDARLAVRRKRSKEGFRDYPRGFVIAPVEIGRDLWSEGFVTYRYVPKKKPIQALETTRGK